MADVERWEHTLTRRVRALVRTGAFHRLEAGKSSRARDLGAHDLRALALRVIDATIEAMGLGHGARRRDLHEALAPLIRAVEPGVTSVDVAEIADTVIDHLLNEPGRRVAFEERYVAFDGATATERSVVFHLLTEEEADDGAIVLKASTQAINLYAGMLDVDVEDAQTAAEAVLRAQIERGAIGAAVATARQARLRSIEYAETVRSALRQARRDVSQVDARRMLAIVAGARQHLTERLDVERGLQEAVDERLAAADEADAPVLVELRDALGDCFRRHLQLHGEVLGAHDTWLDEQERQRFKPRRASALPDLERDVLQRLVAEPLGTLEPSVDPLLRTLHGPSTPKVVGLAELVGALLAPRRRETEGDLDGVEVELEPLTTLEARFDPPTHARAAAWLAGGGTLGELLRASREAGDAPEVRRLLVLLVLWGWDPPEDAPFTVEAAGSLRDPEFVGEDLKVGATRWT